MIGWRNKPIAAMLHPRRKINGRLMLTSENSSSLSNYPRNNNSFSRSFFLHTVAVLLGPAAGANFAGALAQRKLIEL
jgi:hypothetical protein